VSVVAQRDADRPACLPLLYAHYYHRCQLTRALAVNVANALPLASYSVTARHPPCRSSCCLLRRLSPWLSAPLPSPHSRLHDRLGAGIIVEAMGCWISGRAVGRVRRGIVCCSRRSPPPCVFEVACDRRVREAGLPASVAKVQLVPASASAAADDDCGSPWAAASGRMGTQAASSPAVTIRMAMKIFLCMLFSTLLAGSHRRGSVVAPVSRFTYCLLRGAARAGGRQEVSWQYPVGRAVVLLPAPARSPRSPRCCRRG